MILFALFFFFNFYLALHDPLDCVLTVVVKLFETCILTFAPDFTLECGAIVVVVDWLPI